MSFILCLRWQNACEALRLQQHFLPVSQLYTISSLLTIIQQHHALLSVQLRPVDEPTDTDMGTNRQVDARSVLRLQVSDEVLGAKHLCVVMSVASLIDSTVLMEHLDGLSVLPLLHENEGDAAEMNKPRLCICAVQEQIKRAQRRAHLCFVLATCRCSEPSVFTLTRSTL